ncbi:hypothetical protein [Halalkalibacter urbisdiaboli]|uniref:hypothetical protein n=1 Tax=Halalkalibacter urbisdiaboli TaxID=1960589 RepID=UPI000B430057|nr:hypothetical protein [Halalkalibacter urbisdiaboli]
MLKKQLLYMIIFLIICPSLVFGKEVDKQVTLIVKASGEAFFQSELLISSEPMVEAILKANSIDKIDVLPVSNNYLLLEDGSQFRIYMMDDDGYFYNIHTKEKIKIASATAKKLKLYFSQLHERHYGALLPWEKVDKILPRYSTFEVTDIETGYRFNVQRRAGKNHADVQPLTRKDTKIMKAIYGGKWSWNRKAILVHINDQTIAASMHGMPHGGGAIVNGFPGHFCIHFKDCVTHRTKSLDLSHQVMIYKAAGELSSFIKALNPFDVIQLFFIALNHNDLELLQYVSDEDLDRSFLEEVEFIRATTTNPTPTIEGSVLFELPLTYVIKEKGKRETEKTFTFKVKRNTPTEGWQLETIPK